MLDYKVQKMSDYTIEQPLELAYSYKIPTRQLPHGENEFPLLRSLSKKLGLPIAFFDLETTTFVGKPTFGITECCAIHFDGEGPLHISGDLINPQFPIEPAVIELTSITNEMVAVQPTFASWVEFMEDLANNYFVMGYNSTSFDVPGVRSQMLRYVNRPIEFKNHLDVRSRYIELMRSTGNGKKGKLSEVLALFGIDPGFGFHRAEFDTMGTALLAEEILRHYGFSGLLGRVLHELPSPSENVTKISKTLDTVSQNILHAIRADGYNKEKIAIDFNYSVNKVAEVAYELFDAGNVLIEEIYEPANQEWLITRIRTVAEECWMVEEDYKRYKPVYLALKLEKDAPNFDYTQMKIALIRTGMK